jgi:hypothetical protein
MTNNPNKWTENHIATVGAQAASIPDTPVLHFQSAKAVPVAIREVLKEVDAQMGEIEQSTDFTPDAISSRRKALALDAIAKLPARSKIDAAKQAADRRKAALASRAPKSEPKTAEQIQIASEIRAYVAKSESPLLTASKLARENPQAADAILNAPGFLTGLKQDQIETIRAALPQDEGPAAQEIAQIDRALKTLAGALTSATSMIATRAGLARGLDGSWQ